MDIAELLRNNFPLLIPLMGMLVPIVAILAYYSNKSSRQREMHETIRQLIKAGQPIPPELLNSRELGGTEDESERRTKNRNYYLQSGVANTAIGFGLMVMFFAIRPGGWLWAIGAIPFCLGIGFLLLWNYERKQNAAR